MQEFFECILCFASRRDSPEGTCPLRGKTKKQKQKRRIITQKTKMSSVLLEIGISDNIAKIITDFIGEEFEVELVPDDDDLRLDGLLPRFDCFGCIIPSFVTLSDSFEYAKSIGISTFQSMFGDSISTERQIFSRDDILRVKTEFCAKRPRKTENASQRDAFEYPDFKCFSHLPFTFSLVGTSKRGIFKIDPLKKKFHDPYAWRICKAIEYELSITKELNGGTVIHPGTAIGTTEESIEAAVRFIDSINYPFGSKLLLENSAGEGKKFASLNNLNIIYERCKSKENIFFCLDSAHIFASGEYDISKIEEIDRLYEDIQSRMGIGKIALIHLNDSKTEFGSHKDRHEFSCQGHIWKDNFFSFLYFLGKFENIPLVCETDPALEDVRQIRRRVYD
jgi:hypothetical protein